MLFCTVFGGLFRESSLNSKLPNYIKCIFVQGTAWNNVGVDVFNSIGTLTTMTMICGIHYAGGNRAIWGIIYPNKDYASIIAMDYNGTMIRYVFSNNTWTTTTLHS